MDFKHLEQYLQTNFRTYFEDVQPQLDVTFDGSAGWMDAYGEQKSIISIYVNVEIPALEVLKADFETNLAAAMAAAKTQLNVLIAGADPIAALGPRVVQINPTSGGRFPTMLRQDVEDRFYVTMASFLVSDGEGNEWLTCPTFVVGEV